MGSDLVLEEIRVFLIKKIGKNLLRKPGRKGIALKAGTVRRLVYSKQIFKE